MHASCDDIRATLIEAVAAGHVPGDPAVLAHVESCPACRAARADYEQLWKQMGSLVTPEPAPDIRMRFRRRLASEGGTSARPLPVRVLAAVAGAAAAVALVAGLGGYRLGTRHPGEGVVMPGSVAASAQPVFLLLLHEDSTYRLGLPFKPNKALAAEYGRWADGLPAGTYIRSEALERHQAVWLGTPHGPIAPGDYVDGYFLIHAKDLAEAERIAASCPHIKYGGRIEVHELDRAIDTFESP